MIHDAKTDRFASSECGRLLLGIEQRLREGHLLNAIYMSTELQQAMLKEHGKIRHGEQYDVSWLQEPE